MKVSVMSRVAVILSICGSLSCTSIQDIIGELPASPKRSHIEAMAALLPPQQAKELLVYNKDHSNIMDARIHTGKTCPILIYKPKYDKHEAGQITDLEWAEFLHDFFEDKHDEEKDDANCDCEEQLQ